MHAHPKDEVVGTQIDESCVGLARCGALCESEAVEGFGVSVGFARSLDPATWDADMCSWLECDAYGGQRQGNINRCSEGIYA